MKHGKTALLALLSGVMDLCWLHGWASLSVTAATGRALPAVDLACVFAASAVVTRLSTGRGLRVIYVLCLHCLGLAAACAAMVRAVYYGSYPPLGTAWILAFLHQPRTAVDWICLVLVLAWAPALWALGAALARRERSYYAVCSRFDIGLAAFFALFLLRFAIEVKGGVRLGSPSPAAPVFSFFLAGLLATGTARAGEGAQKSYQAAFRVVGPIIASAASLLSAGGLALLFLPWLTRAARMGQEAVKARTGPLLPIIEAVLRFLFAHGNPRPERSGKAGGGFGWHPATPSAGSSFGAVLMKAFLFLICIAGGLVLLGLVVLLLYSIAIWLLSRTAASPGTERRGRRESLLARLVRLLASFPGWLKSLSGSRERACDFYQALGRWARRSGVQRSGCETPAEFGARLKGSFPRLAGPIETMVGAVNLEVYREKALTDEGMRPVRAAWRAMTSPANWPGRMKRRLWGTQPSSGRSSL